MSSYIASGWGPQCLDRRKADRMSSAFIESEFNGLETVICGK